ncbi:hypothetical protein HKD37_20G056023 [Glycine soja]
MVMNKRRDHQSLAHILMQSYPARALDRRLQVEWAKDAREGPRVLMSLRISKLIWSTKFRALLSLSLHSSPSSSKLLSMTSYGVSSPLSLPSPFRCHSSSKKQRNPLMKKILGLQAPMELASCGRHRSHLRPHSHRRENERKPQEVNIKLPYFHGKDNVEANLDWEIRVEQQLKRKSTSKSYGSHSYPKKDQGQGILGVRPSKPKDDKGKTIEKQPLKASMQEKTSSMKCFKCLGRGHITSQCPTKKTMIMRGQDIYSSQDEAITSPSSSESEEAKGGESSEEIYPQEEGQPLMVKEECKEVSVSSKRLAKKEIHFEIKTNIKEISLLKQPPHFLLCKKTLVRIATPLRLEFIPQVKELLDEGLVRKSLNPCALLVPKIGIIRHQIPKIGGMMNALGRATLICKITRAPNIFMICVHRDSLGTHMGHLRFVILFGMNNQHENTEKGVEEKSPGFQEPQDLSGVSSLSSFSIPLPFIFQEAKESIDEEDPRPTSSNGACITFFP